MTFDYEINDEWDIFVGHRGDLSIVTGRDLFEQEIAIRIQTNIVPIIGEYRDESVKDLAELTVFRVASEMDEIDRVESYAATFSSDEANTLEVEVVYDTGDALTFTAQ